jgi:hypothetical protein
MDAILTCILIISVILLIYYVWDDLVNKGSAATPEKFVSGVGLSTREYQQPPEHEGYMGGATLSNANSLLTGGDVESLVADSIMKEAYGAGDVETSFGDEESKSLANNMMADLHLDDSYNSYLVSSQLDEGTLASHQQFVYDQHRLRNKGGTAAHHTIFTPPDPVPWVGLRRPDYSTASSDYDTRMGQEYSVRSSQLQQQRPNMIGL